EVRTMSNALKALAVLAVAIMAGAWWYGRASTPRPSAKPIAHDALDAAAPAPLPEPEPETRQMPAVVPLPAIDSPAPSARPPAAATLEELVARLMPAVVRIESAGSIGTGFFIQPDTILTNAHVVQNNLSITVRRSSGVATFGRVDTVAPGLDLAVVKVPADANQ